MKILFFINCLAAGGKERRLVELMKGLKNHPEIQFELIVMEKDIHYKEVYDLGIKIHFLIRKSKKDFRIFKLLYNYCKEYKPDIIHCWDSMTSIYSVPVCRLLNIKLVNGMVVDTPVKTNFFSRGQIRARMTFPFSNIVIGNSNAGLTGYKAPRKKSQCIYNGFNFERLNRVDHSLSKSSLNIAPGYLITMVGAFSDRKDYDTYISAAKMICDKRNDVTFIAIGDGGNFTSVLNKITHQYKDRIQLLGKRSNVESLIAISDICVLTTNAKVHGEGISNSILEYMALGKPVIATTGGGTNEIVENNITGFLISSASPGELSEKIETLLDNRGLREKMGVAGKERIANMFSIEKMVNSYIEVYKKFQHKKKSNSSGVF
ncbi:MAG: glycosyltransferase [Bacteroidetes bacterium]|nr:glycosyltransferase [Bacteroidota bacterium]